MKRIEKREEKREERRERRSTKPARDLHLGFHGLLPLQFPPFSFPKSPLELSIPTWRRRNDPMTKIPPDSRLKPERIEFWKILVRAGLERYGPDSYIGILVLAKF